ncbi:hypothetical protein QYF61_026404 [Mycteria americana]|uniref:glucuronosyltransferase n=1 Tax=Mycteria americana TaxID=33587 RepID=A0AAN7RRX6_MYCAM|nr:hypothetical protein QYF61_026404 [Mycteria americana]
MTLQLCCAWIFILLLPGLSDGGKLLVVPMDGSHWLSMRQVVEKLTERGHEVVVVIPEVSWQMKTTPAYTVKTYPVSYTIEELDNAFHEYVATHLKDLPFPLNALALYNNSVHVFRTFFVQCRNLFSSKETLQYLNQSGFDAVLTDPIFMCGATLANYLSLPFVFFMRGFPCNLHYEAPQCPSPLSYTPRLFTFNSDRMTFFQRVENALVALLELVYCNGFYEDAIKFSSEVLQRDVSLLDLLNSASVWLLRFDFVFEYVRPVMPNMVFIGGINCAQRKPLSKTLLLCQRHPLMTPEVPEGWHGGRILVIPQDGSHWLSMHPVVGKLQQNGHEVVVVVPSASLYMKPKQPQNYTVKVYPIPYTEEHLAVALKSFINAHFIEQSVLNIVITMYQSILEISRFFFTNCESLLHNKDMMQYLRESEFDVVFTDPMLMCGPIIAEYLSVPSVFFLRGFPCGMDSEATQCPNPPSYVPRLFLKNSDSMTFAQRVKNMLAHMLEFVYCKPIFTQIEELAYEIFQKKVTATDLLSHGSIWLMRYDFVFEFPRPVMPNMVFIGGINCDQKKKLSQV